MEINLQNAKANLAQLGLDPSKDDLGAILINLSPEWYSWSYDENLDQLTISFNIQVGSGDWS
jgi:hypothetical protein